MKQRVGTIAQRVLGVLLIIVGVAGIGLAIAGGIVVGGAVDGIAEQFDTTLTVAAGSLDTVEGTLRHVQKTLSSVTDVVDTASTAASGISETISATGSSVDSLAKMAANQLPAILGALGSTVEELGQTAQAINTGLESLSKLTRGLIDLGGALPSGEAAADLQNSLEVLTGDVEGLANNLNTVSDTVGPISGEATTMTDNLAAINQDLHEYDAMIDQYVEMVVTLREGAIRTQENLPQMIVLAKVLVGVLALWIVLLHVPALNLGWRWAAVRGSDSAIQQVSEQRGSEALAEITDPAEPGS